MIRARPTRHLSASNERIFVVFYFCWKSFPKSQQQLSPWIRHSATRRSCTRQLTHHIQFSSTDTQTDRLCFTHTTFLTVAQNSTVNLSQHYVGNPGSRRWLPLALAQGQYLTALVLEQTGSVEKLFPQNNSSFKWRMLMMPRQICTKWKKCSSRFPVPDFPHTTKIASTVSKIRSPKTQLFLIRRAL